MAEEVRLFVRSLVYLVPAAIVYWVVSAEPAGTVLLAFLVVASVAFVAVAAHLAPSVLRQPATPGSGGLGRLLGALNRAIGFGERADTPPPLVARSELVPLASPWPILAALAAVVVALGLVFGPWLLLPGLVLVALTAIGWITQLDRP